MKQTAKVGRNDPCVCGSNQKYKKCCLPKFEAQSMNPIPQAFNHHETEDLMKKIGKIIESKNMSLEDMNNLLAGRSFDDIAAEYDALTTEYGPKEKAENIYERALDESSPVKRIAMLEKALEIYPELPDAWCLLGAEKAKTCHEAVSYFEKAVHAGRNALGETFFKDNAGHFWGLIESRPFMRAKAYLADALLGCGRIDEAISHFEDCLTLNPNDNQGLRYELLSLYLHKNCLFEVEKILNQYEDDSGASWEYSKALYFFKKEGAESFKAAEQLNIARKTNKYVLEYLTGKKKLPKTFPSTFIIGSKEEAQIYVSESLKAWQTTLGAISWLTKWS